MYTALYVPTPYTPLAKVAPSAVSRPAPATLTPPAPLLRVKRVLIRGCPTFDVGGHSILAGSNPRLPTARRAYIGRFRAHHELEPGCGEAGAIRT